MGRTFNTHYDERNLCKIFVGQLEGKRQLAVARSEWVDNIEMHLRENILVWTRLIWRKVGTSGGPLWIR
jgi:hypothetical protein